MKILVIEDEKMVRESLKEILEFEGYSVVEAENGLQGLEKAQELSPELVFCDIRMPGIDGFEVIRRLRKQPTTASLPVILLTALSDMVTMREGMDIGADDFIAKPFTRNMLVKAINTRLARVSNYDKKAKQKVDQFLERLSMLIPHELRTPLASVIGYSEYVRKYFDTLSKQEVLDMISTVHESGHRLHHTIEQFITYSTLSTENVQKQEGTEPDKGTTLLEKAAATVIKRSSEIWDRENDIEVDVEDHSVAVPDTKLEKLLYELLSNAAKYAEKGTPIRLKARRHPASQVEITVENSGRGLSKRQIANISAFNQFDREEYEQQGLGLGLSIARLVAQLYDGSMHIESGRGRDTKVKVRLPVEQKETAQV